MNSHRWHLFLVVAALVAITTSCGGHDTTTGPAAALNKDAGSETTQSIGAVPCNISTGYAGDSQCIEAPPDGKGFQFHYGPKDYSQAEIAKFLLMPGEEKTDCMFFPTPNTAEVYFNEYHSRMRPGSHHMLLYTQTANQPTSDAPVQCNQGLSRNLFGAQQATFDATAISKGPENAGLAVSIAPQQQGVIQVHFINTTSKPMLRETWANVVYIDKANVKILGDPIFFIAGATLNLKMGSTTVSTGTSTVPANADPNFRLVMATGHYHTHTTRFTAYKIINGQKELLFEEWNPLHALPEPGNWLFDTVTKNPAVNEATQSKGAFTGPVYMKPGDQIQWECAVNNDDVSPTSPAPYNANSITFANAVYTGEMCNMFGIYAPTLGCAWNGGQSTALAGSKCSGG